MASFDSTIGILRDDLTFEAKFYEGTAGHHVFSLGILPHATGISRDYIGVTVKDKDQMHALRAALYAALADSYASEGEALTILPALTGNAVKDMANLPSRFG